MLEAKINRLDGTVVEVEIHAAPFQDQGHNAVHVVLLDVSEKKQAEETLRRDEARFRLLATTAGALLASPFPQRAVEELCTRVMEHLDCQVFFNFLVDEPGGRLHLKAFAGIPEEEARKIEWLDYGVAVCGCVARDQQRIVAEDIFHQPDIRTDLVRSFGVQAYACHPLIAQGRLLGTLSFGTKTRSSFSPQDLELMKTVTDQATTAMEKIRLLETIQAGRDELEQRVQERTGELKKANAQLAEQSRILESFFRDTITPLVLLDRDFNFIRVNEAYARTCQRSVADFPGHNHFEFYPHEENEAIFREVVKTGNPLSGPGQTLFFPGSSGVGSDLLGLDPDPLDGRSGGNGLFGFLPGGSHRSPDGRGVLASVGTASSNLWPISFYRCRKLNASRLPGICMTVWDPL